MMFPGIIQGARSSKVVSGSISTSFDGLIQEVRALGLHMSTYIPKSEVHGFD
jgi:hypothetical protein